MKNSLSDLDASTSSAGRYSSNSNSNNEDDDARIGPEEEMPAGRWCITCFAPRRRAKGISRRLSVDSNSASSVPEADSSSYMNESASSRSSSNNRYPGADNFSMKEILKATGSFAPNNVIGKGRFGTMYRGKLRDGTLVAVKRANANSIHSSMLSEFENEVRTLSRVEHLNLVRCFGYLEQDDEKIIIFEHVGNGNLREHLDGFRGVELEMSARIDIAIDVAHAVTYLHSYADRPIIHRDIKASNILITEKLRAKVSDFGLAYLAPDDRDQTHVSTVIEGTIGYLDPEYLKTYQLTEKSDVYSFGVLLVELITGRQPIESQRQSRERMTIRWAMHRYKAGEGVMTMDPRLRRNRTSVTAVEKILRLAYHCLAPTRRARPSMRQCAEVLWGIRKHYQETLEMDVEGRS